MRGAIVRGIRVLLVAVGLSVVVAQPATAAGNPDFDAVPWTPLGCETPDLVSHTSPAAVDFAGDAAHPAAYFAHDASYVYFRYRTNGDPSMAHGFAQYAWTALMQVPGGNPFQYQYQLSLNGKSNTIEIWQNTVASDISFSPLFHDDAEVQLFSQKYNVASAVNSTALARSFPTGDGSAFGGNADYFIDFAFPVSVMVANGIVSGASDLDQALFFPATSTNPNNYNKGYLNCPFQPMATLSVAKTVFPASAAANQTTPLAFTIRVLNQGPGIAKGIEIDDPALPAYMTNVTASVSADDASVAWTLDSTNPLQVRVNNLPAGATVTVQLSADATPACTDGDFTNTASVWGVNAQTTTGSVVLHAGTASAEICDGLDNNCNGQVDDGGNALCDDGDACTVDACNGHAGCSHTRIPGCVSCVTSSDCDDSNACTTESCVAGVCHHTAIPGCIPCATPGDCNDNNACTTETCDAGVCGHTAIPGCVPCTTPGDCNDGNACTTETCDAGVCGHSPVPGCTPCSTPGDCDDQNACTTETCDAGACGHTAIPGCTPCSTPGDCDDQNACTTETCDAGACGHTAIPGCTPCSTPGDCDDQNACTTETCDAGVCGHTAMPGCTPCSAPADCDDHNACTTETCDAGVCGHVGIPDCIPCSTPGDCDDGNACTTETCDAGVCGHTGIAGCIPCSTPDDCSDGNACTIETCDAGACGHTAIPGCVPCSTDVDCDDLHGCTADACVDGACSHTAIPGCASCTTAADCGDGNACTVDVCSADLVCHHDAQPGCKPCATAADCSDGNACTSDQCGADGSCQITVIPGCVPCTTVTDCDDHDDCTTDACTDGACTHEARPDCPATPPHEICGNCIDDDGNGLTDYEDPACCSEELPLAVKRMLMKTIVAKARGNRLRLKARYTKSALALFDPMTQDTSIQIADADGQLFCQTVAASHWKHPHRRLYRFKDKQGTFAGGLAMGRFKVKRNGAVIFRTRGKTVRMRYAGGKNVVITLRVGNQCARETMNLRTTKKQALVFP